MILAVEDDLVTRAAAGDTLALDSVLRPLLKPGYRLAYMLLRDREAAEDAVQEAALKSWRKLSKLRTGSDPRPWFLGFVANECRNTRRSRWRTVLKLGLRGDVQSGESHMVSNLDLRRAVDGLSHADRVVVLLHFYMDMTLEEIGAATGLRPAAVKSRLYRAIKRLRPHLSVEEATDG
jgi:RNA polymerase sigma-70 factor, ECF subfamily